MAKAARKRLVSKQARTVETSISIPGRSCPLPQSLQLGRTAEGAEAIRARRVTFTGDENQNLATNVRFF
jgi:hypothetical protein